MQLTLSQLGRVSKTLRALNDLAEATGAWPPHITTQVRFEDQPDLALSFVFLEDTKSFALTDIEEYQEEAVLEVVLKDLILGGGDLATLFDSVTTSDAGGLTAENNSFDPPETKEA